MIGRFLIRDSVVQDIPYGHQHLAGDSDLHLHSVLASQAALSSHELVEEGVFCSGCAPGTFNHGFSKELVAMRYPARFDFACAFLVTGSEPHP